MTHMALDVKDPLYITHPSASQCGDGTRKAAIINPFIERGAHTIEYKCTEA